MVKVCHLTSVHKYSDPRIFYKECCSLSNNGYDVTLIVPNTISQVISDIKIISFIPKSNNRLNRMLFTVNNIFKIACEVDADIYHLHDPELLRIALKLKRRGKKVIYDSHEFYSLQILERNYIPSIFKKIISRLYSMIEAHICKRIDAVIQVCPISGKNFFEGRCRRSIYLPNTPIVYESYSSVPDNVEKVDSVVYVGSLTYQRGISHLVDASLYTDVKIELVGNFSSEEYRRDIMNGIAGSNTVYLGFIQNENINSFLTKRIAGISTLLNLGQYCKIDTLPTKVYEYLLAGIPVILSDTKFNKNFIERYKCGICVNPSNPHEISNAINYLNNNRDIANQMGRNGKDAVINNFSWNHQEKTLLELYKEIMSIK